MNKISAKIIADSVNPQGDRITSYILTYPRIIHAEVMTHRVFSRNAASSRAIPFNKMVESIENDPFTPVAWQKDHKGMQGTEYFTNDLIDVSPELRLDVNVPQYSGIFQSEFLWDEAKTAAIRMARSLNELGVTKQLVNRLLEPFQWYTCLVTATEYDNFFNLRMPSYEIDLDDLESLK